MSKRMYDPLSEKWVRYAYFLGALSALILVFISIAGIMDDGIRLTYGYDAWTFLDAGLIAGFTYGIYKQNRFFALAMFIYYVFSLAIEWFSSGQIPYNLVSLAASYVYLRATLSLFDYHNFLVESGQRIVEKREKGKEYYLLLIFGGIFILGLIIFLAIAYRSPEIETIPGQLLDNKYSDFAKSEGLVDTDEKILYWYSDAFGDFKNSFSFITTEKAVVYNVEWDEPAIIVTYDEIDSLDFFEDTSFWEDSQIIIYLSDSSYVYFPVSSSHGGDIKYYDALVREWKNTNDESKSNLIQ